MTNYIILALCVIVILSYIFDISSKFSKIPGVILLIALGMGIQLLSTSTGISIPNIRPLLPVMGTLGLIMIVMEASLDIEISKKRKGLIIKSILSAFILFAVFVFIMTFVLVRFMEFSFRDSLLNSIPLAIISSSIAIPSASGLSQADKEFVVYESSFSDIFGIMIFDFILLSQSSIGIGIFTFVRDGFFTVIVALISSAGLAYLLHKTRYHVNYVIILTSIILIYSLAKLVHLPALLMILIFGLALANNKFLEIDFVKRFVDFTKFRNDISSFKKILGELTFLVRSFFFIMFGYYTQINNLFSWENTLTALIICLGLYLIRWLFFKQVLHLPAVPMVFFSPRGLITILLFLSIPVESKLPLISEEVVTLVILMTIIVMAIGNIIQKGEIPIPETESVLNNQKKSNELI
ncbi:MAG TPA: cation:proton antiporter [Bacteroidales bacterium]|nr:cation:proton antiporter [Bacteroidales bacterium]